MAVIVSVRSFVLRVLIPVFILMLPGVLYGQGATRINMGFYFPSINDIADRTDIEISLTFWTKELTEEVAITESHAFLYDTVQTMRKAFDEGEIDMIIAPPLVIAKYFDRAMLADGFVGVREEGLNNSLLLLVNKNRIDTLKDLRGKRIILPVNDELAEVFLDTLTLKTFKKSFKNIFSVTQPKIKNNRIVLDLFFDKADAAIVYQGAFDVMAELNPQILTKLKILASYPVRAKNFSYFHKDYPLRELLTQKAMSFGEFPRAKQILAVYKTPVLDYCKVEELEMFDTLYAEYLELKKQVKGH